MLAVSTNTFVCLKHTFLLVFLYLLPVVCWPDCPVSQRRIVMLNAEVDRGVEMWKEKQQEAKKTEEHKKSLLLKPKGKLLMKKTSGN